MFVKVIGCVVLLAFCFVQLGSALNCYSCSTPAECAKPTAIACNQVVANATSSHLQAYFTANLTTVVSNNFDCFFHNYTTSVQTSPNVTYKGCIYRSINGCDLTLKTEFSSLKKQDCIKCSGDLCNPAGTFSSSVVTLFASILAVCLYKVLSM